MTTDFSISVIIPAFNAADSIAAAVQSALSQTYRPAEVLVIDDGSSDKTVAVAEEFGDQIRILRQSNAGPAAARNLGIREATGELIAFLDADDRWHPEKLESQRQVFVREPDVGLVHTDVIHFDPQSNREWKQDVGRAKFVGECTELLLQENRLLTSSVVLRRKCLNEIGNFNNKFKGVEDYDLWLRLSSCCKFAFIDQPLVWYCHQAGSLSSHSSAMRAGELEVVLDAISRIEASQSQSDRNPDIDRILAHRLRELNWDVGYDAYQCGSYQKARRHLGSSWKYQPLDLHAGFLWCTTWLPDGLITRLKSMKANWGRGSKSAVVGADG